MLNKAIMCIAFLLLYVPSVSAQEDLILLLQEEFGYFRTPQSLNYTIDDACRLIANPHEGFFCNEKNIFRTLSYDQNGNGGYEQESARAIQFNLGKDTKYFRFVETFYANAASKNNGNPPTFSASITPMSKGSTINVHHWAQDGSIQYRSSWTNSAALGESLEPVDGGYTGADRYQTSRLYTRSNYPVFEPLTPVNPDHASEFLSTLRSSNPYNAIIHSPTFNRTKKLCGSFLELTRLTADNKRRETHVLVSVQATSAEQGLAAGFVGDVYIITINDISLSYPLSTQEIASGMTIEHYDFDGDGPEILAIPDEIFLHDFISTNGFLGVLGDLLGFECEDPTNDIEDDDPIGGGQQTFLPDIIDLIPLGFFSSPGDLNRDGHTTTADLDWFRANINEHYGNLYLYPLQERSSILDSIRANLGANGNFYPVLSPTRPMTLTESLQRHLLKDLPGDTNCDFKVGAADLDLIRGNYDSITEEICRNGDANCDGFITSEDLDIVRANWGNSL